MIYVGTSGYGYHEWSPVFYPQHLCYEEYIAYYSKRFAFCELNASFVRVPKASELSALIARVPSTFRVSVKLHRRLTHERGADLMLARSFARSLEPLVESGQLVAVAAQFPFSFVNNPESRAYLCRLRAALELPLVAELRNDSWTHPETLAFLRGWGVGFACIDAPEIAGIPNRTAVSTSDIGYVRFHGRQADAWWLPGDPRRHGYRYRQRELLSWIPRIREIAKRTRDVCLVFNNRRHAYAVLAAGGMTRLLERSQRSRSKTARARAG